MSSLSNALAILSSFSRATAELGVSELSLKLDLPKSSVSRLMAELEAKGFLERTESRRYRPGGELLRIGSLYKTGVLPIDRIDAELKTLVNRFPASGYIAINKGIDTVVLRMREGISPLRFIVPEGSIVPAFTVAIGKALLARLTDAELEVQLPARARCDNPFYDMAKADLLAEIAEGRQRKWLDLRDMAGRGIEAVATSIQPAGGEPIGIALSFMTSTAPVSARLEMRDALLNLARGLGVSLGDSYWQ